jgi:hypothetical protein
MIGPHEGKELELMLAGQKALAVFHDAYVGQPIPEDIIPEQTFAPYVAQGKIRRFSEDIQIQKDKSIVRCVCFTLPREEWRAEFFLWLKREIYSGRIAHDSSHEFIIGSLLGYSADDITHFLDHKKNYLRIQN